VARRHIRIDDYLRCTPWARFAPGATLVDIGCGFPPLTTVDSANRLSGWKVIGSDPGFGRYLVHDARGDYACFDDDGRLRYFQPGALDPARWGELYGDPAATRRRFETLLEELRPRLPPDHDALAVAEGGGARLVQNPCRQYEQDNLSFVRAGLDDLTVTGADVVRCFNVLVYFDRAFRERALADVGRLLRPGGLCIVGFDWVMTSAARYTVYQRDDSGLTPKEFAFSVDNLRPLEVVSWFTLHGDDFDAGLMAHLVGTVRADERFRRELDARFDAVLAELAFCARGADGYLGAIEPGLPGEELVRRTVSLSEHLEAEGWVDRAVEVLQRAGYHAWRNCVGHVAVTPPAEVAPFTT
jgi:SAM-dependent methyltransferase